MFAIIKPTESILCINYWSNSCGDLHYNGEYTINDVSELPYELQRVWNDLWYENAFGINVYLADLNGAYGIYLESTYDSCYASDMGITYEELKSIARNIALEIYESNGSYTVIFGDDTCSWLNGESESTVGIFLPWHIDVDTFNKVGKNFGDKVYTVSQRIIKE